MNSGCLKRASSGRFWTVLAGVPERLYELESLQSVMLPPVCQRKILTILCDEGAVNFRAANLLSGPIHARVVIVPELSHPTWGDTSRALVSAGLKGALLKATVIINHFRGPFRSGRFGYELQEAARCLVRDTSPDELDRFSEAYSFDIGRNETLTPEAILNAPGIATRLPVVYLCSQVFCWSVLKLFEAF